jgi:hypothetical protein
MSRNSWLMVGLVLALGVGFAVYGGVGTQRITAEEPVKPVAVPVQPGKNRDDYLNQLKKLERIEQSLKDELDATERQLRLMLKADGGLGEERLKGLQMRATELDRELAHLDNERLLADAEREVTKKQLDAGVKVDPLLIMLTVKADPRIAAAISARDKAAETLARAERLSLKAEVTKESQMVLLDADEALVAKKKMVAVDVEETEKARMTLQLKQQLESPERKINFNGLLSDKVKIDRDTIQKAIAASADSKVQIETISTALVPLREAIAKVRATMLQLRIEHELAPEK